mmetsp:Transcript_19929/g.50943  ORF Transcript_19929/g.50943 Transcript_19929/m.50943 type:complete len:347 (+) Transcript_19929:774-1814(+)
MTTMYSARTFASSCSPQSACSRSRTASWKVPSSAAEIAGGRRLAAAEVPGKLADVFPELTAAVPAVKTDVAAGALPAAGADDVAADGGPARSLFVAPLAARSTSAGGAAGGGGGEELADERSPDLLNSPGDLLLSLLTLAGRCARSPRWGAALAAVRVGGSGEQGDALRRATCPPSFSALIASLRTRLFRAPALAPGLDALSSSRLLRSAFATAAANVAAAAVLGPVRTGASAARRTATRGFAVTRGLAACSFAAGALGALGVATGLLRSSARRVPPPSHARMGLAGPAPRATRRASTLSGPAPLSAAAVALTRSTFRRLEAASSSPSEESARRPIRLAELPEPFP